MNRHIIAGVFLLSVGQAEAQVTSSLSPSLYYDIGGGVSFTRPLSESTSGLELRVGADLSLPMSCDLFDRAHNDPRAWVDLVGNYIEDEVNELGKAVVAQLHEFGTGLAVAALQRALPGLYDYSQNLVGQVEAKVGVAKRSCEAIVSDINKGVSPLDGWKGLTGAIGWREQLRSVSEWTSAGGDVPEGSNANILTAMQEVSETVNAENDPIPWIEGVAGEFDNPILVTEDLVTAGFNWHADSAALTGSVTAQETVAVSHVTRGAEGITEKGSRMYELFGESDEAVRWAKEFLGEQTVFTCVIDGCDSGFEPGLGLAHMVSEETDRLVEAWIAIMTGPNAKAPLVEQMKSVSSSTVHITGHVYEALMRFPAQDRDLYIGRLINDVGLSITIEKALSIRQMLMTSKEAPVVKGYKEASDNADELIERIRAEIDDLMWGVETQNKLTSNVAGSIIEYDNARRNNALQTLRVSRTKGNVSNILDRPVEADEE